MTAIEVSLAISWDSSNFFSDCFDRVPKRYREWEGIKAFICTIFVRFSSLSLWTFFENPNCEVVHNWISNHISKFHDNPTVNESRIVVLLRQFWVFARKEKVAIKRVFSQIWHLLIISNENVWKWVPTLVLKFHNDPTANESEIIIFLR